MQDTPAKLKSFQTYIDGKWCNAASGKTFKTYDPYIGRSLGRSPRMRCGRCRQGLQCCRQSLRERPVAGDDADRAWRACCARSRG